MKKQTKVKQTNYDNFGTTHLHRIRSFELAEIERANLFEGLPYIQFDAFIRRDRTMQHVVVRDLLKIITEKCNTLKNLLLDKGRMKKVFQLMDLMNQSRRKAQFNIKLEETIALIDSIGSIILQDYSKYPETIGLSQSPIYPYQKHRELWERIELPQEEKIYENNVELFIKMLTYLRDRVDVYMIMIRQANQKIIDDTTCMELLKNVTALRFNLLQLSEDIRIYDQNSDEHMRLLKLTSTKSEEALRKIEFVERSLKGKTQTFAFEDTPESEMQKKRAERLNELLQKKFNFNKNSLTSNTRVVLNQDKLEQEKLLLLESNQKASKIKHVRADNRKRMAMEKLKDPTKDPNLREALEIMSRVLNINIADQFQ